MTELAFGFYRMWLIVPTPVQIALLIWISYTVVAVNTCAIAKVNYRATFATSLLFMVINFFLIKHVAEAKSLNEFYGYCVGGVAGDMSGIWISKRWNIV